jgi:hypothetical protein
MKARLREVAEALDPLQLLEEIRAMQSHLVVLADGGQPYEPSTNEVNLANFLAGLSSAWRAGEIRPTHSPSSSPPRYLRRVQIVVPSAVIADGSKAVSVSAVQPDRPASTAPTPEPACPVPPLMSDEQPKPAVLPVTRRIHRPQAFKSIWPDIVRRLEARPNLNGSELFDQLRTEYPGRYVLGQRNALLNRIKNWRAAATARGIVIGRLTHRPARVPRTWRTRPDIFEAHWPEMCQQLETDPDQTGRELFAELRSRYPDQYQPGQIRTLQRRLQIWRKQAARRLVFGVQDQSFTIP